MNHILDEAKVLKKTPTGDTIYESQSFCLNIAYKYKNNNNTSELFNLHSASPESDYQDVLREKKKVEAIKTVPKHKKNPFGPETPEEEQVVEVEPDVYDQMACLVPFNIWKEKDVSQIGIVNDVN